MIPESAMVGSEIRSSRVAMWYSVLPSDVQRVVAQPSILSEDVDEKVERMADAAIKAWKTTGRPGPVLEAEIDLLRSIGPAARIRLLSIMTTRDHAGAVNVFASIVRESRENGSDDSTSGSDAGDGAAADVGPSAALVSIFRSDLAGLERIIAARLVRSTSAKRTVSAIVSGIEDYEQTYKRSQGAFL
jgi:hypothetical protein